MNLSEVTKKANLPKWEHDTTHKVYIVFDELGREHTRFPYKDIWNSSPAMRDATKEVNKIKSEISNREKFDWENRPLSKLEIRYQELRIKCQKYFDAIKSGALDDETKSIYYDTMSGWSDEMIGMADSNLIRKSIIMGTYKSDK
jgi:hypothetical protein